MASGVFLPTRSTPAEHADARVRLATMDERSEVLLIGGRSGVGKSSVALEMVEQLSAAGVRHA